MTPPDFALPLEAALRGAIPGLPRLTGLTQLSGGASQETWRIGADAQAYILRRTPGGAVRGTSETAVSLETEAGVVRAARAAGVPAPEILWVSDGAPPIGAAYVMGLVEGETIPRKILRDQAYANARPVLARQCGEVLARIHATPRSALPPLRAADARAQWEQYRAIYDGYGYPHPVFEAAFRWLETRLPGDGAQTLVHGDFRLGNLMVGPEGLRAVLDWELTHLGDPAEDLGWICVNSWRFGQPGNPVGGFGALADLLAGYAAAGGHGMSRERVRFWVVMGSLKWGIMCMTMVKAFETGADASVERAAIGRRASETEIDLMNLMYGGADGL
jgi:aminoglycoside phosphotransferase (APT) family kinase protein